MGALCGVAGTVIVVHTGFTPVKKETQAERDARVVTMTPEQFPARCGKLVSDKLRSSSLGLLPGEKPEYDNRDVTVELTMPGGERQDVTAVFYKEKSQRGGRPKWSLGSVGGYLDDTGPLGGLKTIEELYPCTTRP